MDFQEILIEVRPVKYLFIFLILIPVVVSAQVSGAPTPSKNESSSGYTTKDCDKKCPKDQQCALNAEDEKYHCINVSAKAPKPLEVYISCKSISGTLKKVCSSKEIAVSAISGKNQIPVREDKPGQCCILKSKLKVN
ncbi:MAG: hypothetical protein ACYDHW_03385 [Syntrophorhabdaceae bacterium]